VTIRRGWWNY